MPWPSRSVRASSSLAKCFFILESGHLSFGPSEDASGAGASELASLGAESLVTPPLIN